MNTIRSIAALNQRELEAGTSDAASWHADYSDTAYIYIGGLPYELSEGDIISIFSQYGEPVHCNLIRDKETGKSRGFAFLKYEDQRSTNLAVDNLSGANVLGRTISVDHHRYKHKEGEEKAEEEARDKKHAETGNGRSSRVRDEDDSQQRRRRVENDEDEARHVPTQKEEELMKLMKDIDDDDPMKEYMIQQKREEIEAEKALVSKAKMKKRDRADRDHSHRDSERHSHKHRSRHRSSSPGRDRSPYRRRSHSPRDRKSQRTYGETKQKGEYVYHSRR